MDSFAFNDRVYIIALNTDNMNVPLSGIEV